MLRVTGISLLSVSSVQSLSCVWLFATPWTAARQASLSITNSRSPPKPVSIESVMPSNHLILCLPLLLLPSIFPSIRIFSIESALRITWPKDWSFSFNISPSNEHPGLISFSLLILHKKMLNTLHSGSIQFSRSVVSDSLWPHGLKHTRPPCPSPTPGACSNSCLQSRWCHPTISSSVIPFSSCLQSSPASGSLQMSQFFISGSQSIGVSASASVLPMNTQDWSPLGWTGWISLQFKGLSRVFPNTIVQKHQFFSAQLSLWSNSHIHTWLQEKP